MTLKIEWIDIGREPTQKPNPRYPDGVDVDLRANSTLAYCREELPYPAKRCGYFYVECDVCGVDALITTAGRPDDPRTVKMPCKSPVKATLVN
jgi:hypothetical protein